MEQSEDGEDEEDQDDEEEIKKPRPPNKKRRKSSRNVSSDEDWKSGKKMRHWFEWYATFYLNRAMQSSYIMSMSFIAEN